MSLINCGECGKKISDKASTCPGCGCPVDAKIELRQWEEYDDYGVRQLFNMAVNYHYDIINGAAEAHSIYRYIIDKYPKSNEASLSISKLDQLSKESPELFSDQNNKPIQQVAYSSLSKIDIGKYYKVLGLDSESTIDAVKSKYAELSEKWNPAKYENEPSLYVHAEGMYKEIQDAYTHICQNNNNRSSENNSNRSINENNDVDGANLFTTIPLGLIYGIIIGALLTVLMLRHNTSENTFMTSIYIAIAFSTVIPFVYSITKFRQKGISAFILMTVFVNFGEILGFYLAAIIKS